MAQGGQEVPLASNAHWEMENGFTTLFKCPEGLKRKELVDKTVTRRLKVARVGFGRMYYRHSPLIPAWSHDNRHLHCGYRIMTLLCSPSEPSWASGMECGTHQHKASCRLASSWTDHEGDG